MKRNPLISVAILLLPIAAVQGQDTPLWRYTTNEKISFYQVTSMGDLVVGTKEKVVALDPETGDVRWSRNDILKPPGFWAIKINPVPFPGAAFAPIPFSPYAVLRTKDGIALIDLATGETLWNSTTMPLKKVRGHLTVPQHNLVLVYGESSESKRTLIAVDVATGEVGWRHDTLFRRSSPNLLKTNSLLSLSGHQPPVVDSDTTFILNLSKDGPMRIHSRTGKLLWRLDSNNDPPMLSEGHAPMLYGDGVLYVAYEKSSLRFSTGERKLMALSASDGSITWDRKFPIRVIQMELAPHGLVVRGLRPPPAPGGGPPEYEAQVREAEQSRERVLNPGGLASFIDLVDPETGLSLWRSFKTTRTKLIFGCIVEEDAIFFATVLPRVREQRWEVAVELAALAFADGSAQVIAVVDFESRELPDKFEGVGTNFFLSSNQNFLSVDRGGTVLYHRYYDSPGRSTLENVVLRAGGVAPDSDLPEGADPHGILSRFRNAEHWANFAYVYTKQPDSSGREGFSLVRLDKRNGEEVGRVWINKRRPDYVLDWLSGFVFVKVNKKEINAHKFPDN